MLSQQEIDALLNWDGDHEDKPKEPGDKDVGNHLSQIETDTIGLGSTMWEKTEEEIPESIASKEMNTEAENIEQPAPQSAGSQHLGSSLGSDENKADIQSAMFSDFDETDEFKAKSQNLNMLFDIPLQVTVELGRTKRTVKDILQMSPGTVIELDKLAGEPVDIYVNGKRIAKGEVVVIDENFGVRVKEITRQSDRIQNLK